MPTCTDEEREYLDAVFAGLDEEPGGDERQVDRIAAARRRCVHARLDGKQVQEWTNAKAEFDEATAMGLPVAALRPSYERLTRAQHAIQRGCSVLPPQIFEVVERHGKPLPDILTELATRDAEARGFGPPVVHGPGQKGRPG